MQRNLKGFCADHLMRPALRVPGSVLARAKAHSSYQPSRQLRLRTQNGYYVLNPELQLRANGGAAWLTWQQWLNQPLVYAGCGIVTRNRTGNAVE